MNLANRIAKRIAGDYLLIGGLLSGAVGVGLGGIKEDREASIKRIVEIVEEEQKKEET